MEAAQKRLEHVILFIWDNFLSAISKMTMTKRRKQRPTIHKTLLMMIIHMECVCLETTMSRRLVFFHFKLTFFRSKAHIIRKEEIFQCHFRYAHLLHSTLFAFLSRLVSKYPKSHTFVHVHILLRLTIPISR